MNEEGTMRWLAKPAVWASCGIKARINSGRGLGRQDRQFGGAIFGVSPPPPYPLKGLLGAGSAKSVCKILMSKSLGVKILRTKNLGRCYARSAHRHGLDHDRATSRGGARSDVTDGLWKFLGVNDI